VHGKKRQVRGVEKCSKKVKKSVDRHLDLCNSGGTHGKHKLHRKIKYENKSIVMRSRIGCKLGLLMG
jgi:hypothetical protein